MDPCTENGCTEPATRSGLCRRHHKAAYMRAYSRGDNKPPCTVEGCDGRRYGRSPFCQAHYVRVRTTGAPGTKPVRRRAPQTTTLQYAWVESLLNGTRAQAIVASMDETRWVGRKGYPKRAILGMALIRWIHDLPSWAATTTFVERHPPLRDLLGVVPSVDACQRFASRLPRFTTDKRVLKSRERRFGALIVESKVDRIARLLASPSTDGLAQAITDMRYVGNPGYAPRALLAVAAVKAFYGLPAWTQALRLVENDESLRQIVGPVVPSVHSLYRLTRLIPTIEHDVLRASGDITAHHIASRRRLRGVRLRRVTQARRAAALARRELRRRTGPLRFLSLDRPFEDGGSRHHLISTHAEWDDPLFAHVEEAIALDEVNVTALVRAAPHCSC